MTPTERQHRYFLLLLAAVSLAFIAILLPFYGAVFWASVLGILFAPVYRRLLIATRMRPNLAALATLVLCVFVVILPLTLIGLSLMEEGSAFMLRIRSGDIDFERHLQHAITVLPNWMAQALRRLGLGNIAGLQKKLIDSVGQGNSFIVAQALSIGQNTFHVIASFGIMLYLLFFMLRDGTRLAERIRHALPLDSRHKRMLFATFSAIIRATVKGNLVIAAVQGALGSAIFWHLDIQAALLWGAVMAFLSLLPAVGSALVWAPVAAYFLLTGEIWKGVTLIVFSVLVIGLIDNLLRPILIGKDTRMPDYLVLISTIGGLTLFGLNGFIIGPVIAALFITTWNLFAAENDGASAGKRSEN